MLLTAVSLYKNAYSGLSRRMWLLALVMFINRCGTMVLPFMTLYIKHIGFSTRQGGLVVAVYGLGSVAGAFLGGKISDRFGFYYTQLFSLIAGGILFILLGQMKTYEAICICTFFLSMVNESFRPANATAIAHYSSPQNRTQSFSLIRFAINIAWGVGSALGGILASINYHLLFWVDGLTNISGALLLAMLLPKVSLQEQRQQVKNKEAHAKNGSPYSDRTYLIFILLLTLFAICFFQLFVTVPLFFKEGLHLNEFWIGIVMALNGVVIALVEMVIVYKLEGRRPYLILAAYGSVLMAFSFFILNMPLLPGLLIAVLSTLIVTAGEMISMPFMNTYYISRSTETNRGQYAALYTMGWSAAQVIGSSSGAFIANRAGFANLWWMMGAISILVAAGFRWLQMKK